jgi:hypothetical protein
MHTYHAYLVPWRDPREGANGPRYGLKLAGSAGCSWISVIVTRRLAEI